MYIKITLLSVIQLTYSVYYGLVYQRHSNVYPFSSTAQVDLRTTSSRKPIAFMATATHDQHKLADTQVIVFDNVITNIGEAFVNYTSTFTAPVDGIYTFHTTILTGKGLETWGYIDVNCTPRVRYNAQGTGKIYASTTQTLIVALVKGDHVSVRNSGGDGELYGKHYTSFSGYLVTSI